VSVVVAFSIFLTPEGIASSPRIALGVASNHFAVFELYQLLGGGWNLEDCCRGFGEQVFGALWRSIL
jgi:hypothetical protein